MARTGPLTIDEIRETIQSMEDRYIEGQGGLHNAMCRLSLWMSIELLHEFDSVCAQLEVKTLQYNELVQQTTNAISFGDEWDMEELLERLTKIQKGE